MTELQTKQLALLEDTIKFFNSENRCEIDSGCKYFDESKYGCAIGRLIPDKELCKRLDLLESAGVSADIVFNQLPDNLKEYGQRFLICLQNLHDRKANWNNEGLSNDGKAAVDAIKIEFHLN